LGRVKRETPKLRARPIAQQYIGDKMLNHPKITDFKTEADYWAAMDKWRNRPMVRKEMIPRWQLCASGIQLKFHNKSRQFTSRLLILN